MSMEEIVLQLSSKEKQLPNNLGSRSDLYEKTLKLHKHYDKDVALSILNDIQTTYDIKDIIHVMPGQTSGSAFVDSQAILDELIADACHKIIDPYLCILWLVISKREQRIPEHIAEKHIRQEFNHETSVMLEDMYLDSNTTQEQLIDSIWK